MADTPKTTNGVSDSEIDAATLGLTFVGTGALLQASDAAVSDRFSHVLTDLFGIVRELATTQQHQDKLIRSAEVRLLSKAATCRRLGIGDATLTHLIKTKQLPTVRVRKRVKVAAAAVEQLAASGFRRPA